MEDFKDISAERLKAYKLNVVHRIFMVFLVIFFIGAMVDFNNSLSGQSMVKESIIVVSVFTFLGLTIARLTKRFISDYRTLYIVYTLLSTALYFVTILVSVDKNPIMASIMVGPILFMIFFWFELRVSIVFSLAPILTSLYYILTKPTFTVTFGLDYYTNLLFVFGMLLYISYEGIKFYKWHETLLLDEVSILNGQNEELNALNEQFISTQDELYRQYDEIYNLSNTLNLSVKKQEAIINVIEDGLFEYDVKKEAFSFSELARELFNLKRTFKDLNEMMKDALLSEDYENLFFEFRSLIDGAKDKTVVNICTNKKDNKRHFRITMLTYSESNSPFIIASIKETTKEKKQEENMYQLAYCDQLTGLQNRRAFIDRLDTCIIEKNSKIALYLIDIQDFNHINSTFGFGVGDDIIRYIGSGLIKSFGEDKLIARIGGDKFAVVKNEAYDYRHVIETLTNDIRSFTSDQFYFKLKYNVGIAYCKEDLNAMELIENAEAALLKAKSEKGKGWDIFRNFYKTEAEKHLLITGQFDKAISDNELYLNYQPKYDSQTKRLVGFEALVRWQSEELGFISPNEFIMIAEQTGFIRKLGMFILEKACVFLEEVLPYDDSIIVSINISGVQLLHKSFTEKFMKVLNDYNIPSKNIAIEITETAVIENIDIAKEVLLTLKDKGVTIYLDDFGTGYSSLNYLNSLPIDVLKIDKSFTDQIVENNKSLQMVETIIKLAHIYEMDVIAEGVETEEQYLLLKNNGCQIIQGYYFDKPLSDEEAMKRILVNEKAV